MAASVPPVLASQWPVFQASAPWRVVDFISDLHLQASEPATFATWQRYMASGSPDAIFILGDLFEVWVGDDLLDVPDGAFERQCVDVLHAAAQRQPVFFMHGNRDFLLGTTFAQRCGITLLHDPTVLAFGGQRWLLTHGDALCLDDHGYIAFRAEVRTAAWQQAFLTRPLGERRQMARAMRDASQQAQRAASATTHHYADVNSSAARAWLQAAQAPAMLHGHTHRPASHDLGDATQRIVLSDWDAAATPPRAEVLRISLATASEATPHAHQMQRIALT